MGCIGFMLLAFGFAMLAKLLGMWLGGWAEIALWALGALGFGVLYIAADAAEGGAGS